MRGNLRGPGWGKAKWWIWPQDGGESNPQDAMRSTARDEDGGQEQSTHLIWLLAARIFTSSFSFISKREISGGNGRTGVVLSKPEPPVQKGRVGTYAVVSYFDFYVACL